ncbi:hypothetical protein PIB30_004538, partial [Stylosanthes scabra]|nr:hypothetical protein [Stylosanthes scabra]
FSEEVIKETQLELRRGMILDKSKENTTWFNKAKEDADIESCTDPTLPPGFKDVILAKELTENGGQKEDLPYPHIPSEGEILTTVKIKKGNIRNKKQRMMHNSHMIKGSQDKRKEPQKKKSANKNVRSREKRVKVRATKHATTMENDEEDGNDAIDEYLEEDGLKIWSLGSKLGLKSENEEKVIKVL